MGILSLSSHKGLFIKLLQRKEYFHTIVYIGPFKTKKARSKVFSRVNKAFFRSVFGKAMGNAYHNIADITDRLPEDFLPMPPEVIDKLV